MLEQNSEGWVQTGSTPCKCAPTSSTLAPLPQRVAELEGGMLEQPLVRVAVPVVQPWHTIRAPDPAPLARLASLPRPDAAKREALEITKFAIEVGFRHVDCAHVYQNEEQVGQAIRSKIADGTVKREDIFYTSKLWLTSLRPELVRPALEKSLKNLQLDYVDLYIIHIPVALKPGEELFPKDENGKLIFDSVDLCLTWEALEKCKDAGLTKSIGVSNFNHKQLEKILNKPGLKYKPVCNQVECHPYLNQSKLLDFCKSHDIVLVAFGALGSQRVKEWY
ncbi:dihydrodiol dehydrogenase 3 [Bos mutus]|uniref:dihydrodiol dehydrogenase 3 n=1 Tax=Bos mutus TaxID=72004 RepID=UPI0038B6A909